MDALIQEALLAFQQRKVLNIKDGSYEEKDHFNEILLENIHNKLNTAESTLFQNCRKTLNHALDLGRAKNLKGAFEHIKKVEEVLCRLDISYPCQLLITTFYCSGLAYLSVKESKPEEADVLSLQALAINNYLIQEHGYDILEMHRVQQIVNLARIKMAMGQEKTAFKLLSDLIRCFENQPGFPACYKFNPLYFMHEMYAPKFYAPSTVEPKNTLPLQMDKVFKMPLDRFKNNPDSNAKNAVESCFLLNFSALSFELIEKMFDHLILEFIHFTKGRNHSEIGDILYQNGFKTISDLNNYKIYQAAYLFLAMKIYTANEDHPAFLSSLKAFCEKAAFHPFGKTVGSDFYNFCHSSNEISPAIKNQVFLAIQVD